MRVETPCPDCSQMMPYCGRGRHPRCADCRRRRKNETSAAWRAAHPERVRLFQRRGDAKRTRTGKKQYELYGRKHMAMSKWGMTLEEYDAFLSSGCAICGGMASQVDHDHATGQIRGPLCGRCNTGLGYFRDNSGFLRIAAAYLEIKR